MITMIRDAEGFALFSDKTYAVRIDRAYNVREKIAVVVDAFVAKGGRKDRAATAAEVGKAIQEAGE